jgi:hypothetical protein
VKVTIKQFDVQMEIKNKGIELEVRTPNGKHIGDLVLTRTRLVWCPGKTDPANGIGMTWQTFIDLMEARQRR